MNMKLQQFLNDFKNPSSEYTLIPFWFLNDRYDAELLRAQLRDFHAKGVNGVVLHPRIGVAEGKMSAGKKYRGRMDRVIRDYVADMQPELLAARKEHVFITHSGCDENAIASVYGMLDKLHHFDEIHVTRAGGVVSSHCGPGTLGVLFIAGN